MRLWVTRAEPAAARTAARLRVLGHDPLTAPLLRLDRLAVAAEAVAAGLSAARALAFTSRAGVEAFAVLTPDRDLPVFAVGDATASAAREAGWRRVESADGDGAALARLIARSPPCGASSAEVLAPGAREPAFDLVAALREAGIGSRSLALYAAVAAREPPAAVVGALAEGSLDGVLLQSPAAALALAACAAADARFATALAPLTAYALSPACAAPAAPLLSRPPVCAAAPRESDLLTLLPQA